MRACGCHPGLSAARGDPAPEGASALMSGNTQETMPKAPATALPDDSAFKGPATAPPDSSSMAKRENRMPSARGDAAAGAATVVGSACADEEGAGTSPAQVASPSAAAQASAPAAAPEPQPSKVAPLQAARTLPQQNAVHAGPSAPPPYPCQPADTLPAHSPSRCDGGALVLGKAQRTAAVHLAISAATSDLSRPALSRLAVAAAWPSGLLALLCAGARPAGPLLVLLCAGAQAAGPAVLGLAVCVNLCCTRSGLSAWPALQRLQVACAVPCKASTCRSMCVCVGGGMPRFCGWHALWTFAGHCSLFVRPLLPRALPCRPACLPCHPARPQHHTEVVQSAG